MAKVEREQGMTMKDRVDAMGAAMTSAQAVITMPTIARVADGMLQEAGWPSFTAPQVPASLGLPQQAEPAPPQPEQLPPSEIPAQPGMPAQ